jgi:hypothetical protein
MHHTAPTHPSRTPTYLLACIVQHPHTLLPIKNRHIPHVHPPSCRHASQSTHAPFTYNRLSAGMHRAVPTHPSRTPAYQLSCIAQHPHIPHVHPPSSWHASRRTHVPVTYTRLAAGMHHTTHTHIPHVHPPSSWHAMRSTHMPVTYTRLAVGMHHTAPIHSSRTPA